ncbi:unnamed protein product [Amoebophrya sp. A25]|nr:unnamed protein product [Amoebophrya sp. A25]|eukprot:GSA25T00002803001.1
MSASRRDRLTRTALRDLAVPLLTSTRTTHHVHVVGTQSQLLNDGSSGGPSSGPRQELQLQNQDAYPQNQKISVTTWLRVILTFMGSVVCAGLIPGQALFTQFFAEAGVMSDLCTNDSANTKMDQQELLELIPRNNGYYINGQQRWFLRPGPGASPMATFPQPETLNSFSSSETIRLSTSTLVPSKPETCTAQFVFLANIFTTLSAFAIAGYLPAGIIFDALGGRAAAVGGAALLLVGLVFLIGAIQATSIVSQRFLFVTGLLLTDVGSMINSISILGFLWHLPGWNGLLFALSASAYYVSAFLPLLLQSTIMDQFGAPFETALLIYAIPVFMSMVVLFVCVPSAKEYRRAAQKALGIPVPVPKISWRQIRLNVVMSCRTLCLKGGGKKDDIKVDSARRLRGGLEAIMDQASMSQDDAVGRLEDKDDNAVEDLIDYPRQHATMVFAMIFANVASFMYSATPQPYATALFGGDTAAGDQLGQLVAANLGYVGLIFGPASGFIIDVKPLEHYAGSENAEWIKRSVKRLRRSARAAHKTVVHVLRASRDIRSLQEEGYQIFPHHTDEDGNKNTYNTAMNTAASTTSTPRTSRETERDIPVPPRLSFRGNAANDHLGVKLLTWVSLGCVAVLCANCMIADWTAQALAVTAANALQVGCNTLILWYVIYFTPANRVGTISGVLTATFGLLGVPATLLYSYGLVGGLMPEVLGTAGSTGNGQEVGTTTTRAVVLDDHQQQGTEQQQHAIIVYSYAFPAVACGVLGIYLFHVFARDLRIPAEPPLLAEDEVEIARRFAVASIDDACFVLDLPRASFLRLAASANVTDARILVDRMAAVGSERLVKLARRKTDARLILAEKQKRGISQNKHCDVEASCRLDMQQNCENEKEMRREHKQGNVHEEKGRKIYRGSYRITWNTTTTKDGDSTAQSSMSATIAADFILEAFCPGTVSNGFLLTEAAVVSSYPSPLVAEAETGAHPGRNPLPAWNPMMEWSVRCGEDVDKGKIVRNFLESARFNFILNYYTSMEFGKLLQIYLPARKERTTTDDMGGSSSILTAPQVKVQVDVLTQHVDEQDGNDGTAQRLRIRPEGETAALDLRENDKKAKIRMTDILTNLEEKHQNDMTALHQRRMEKYKALKQKEQDMTFLANKSQSTSSAQVHPANKDKSKNTQKHLKKDLKQLFSALETARIKDATTTTQEESEEEELAGLLFALPPGVVPHTGSIEYFHALAAAAKGAEGTSSATASSSSSSSTATGTTVVLSGPARGVLSGPASSASTSTPSNIETTSSSTNGTTKSNSFVQSMSLTLTNRDVALSTVLEDDHDRRNLPPHWYVALLAISPHHRGRGAAQLLLQQVAEWARRDKVPVYLETDVKTAEFYERKCGFRKRWTEIVEAEEDDARIRGSYQSAQEATGCFSGILSSSNKSRGSGSTGSCFPCSSSSNLQENDDDKLVVCGMWLEP